MISMNILIFQVDIFAALIIELKLTENIFIWCLILSVTEKFKKLFFY